MPVPSLKAKDYKSDIKPVWCPGCGHFAVLSALTKAMAHLGLAKEKMAVVSGIGCSSRLPAYIDSYGFHGIHGRALAAASGLKAARPDLTVVAAGGDGDGFSIGGNHFLHACRRNMDMTYIVMDNQVYGMTKGQASPTTRPDWVRSKMTPHGTGIPSFNPAAIALAAGAGFIARGFSGDPTEVTRILVEAMQYPGFAFVQVLSGCVTFRPEQRDWKDQVHGFDQQLPTSDPIQAAQLIQGADELATGVIFATNYPVWQPENRKSMDVAELEEEFCL
ncbi:MAG: 2-oxoacid:ferredoxin oxidoreductase subunit beta [Candidatus Thiodiazotropha sp.]|jgi:2-oxoglutarate/2-oxoacid ferredoxin oxidoreductase subunit beta